jgi:hypothetical protein
MRTTLTLADDVSVMLKKLQEEQGLSFKEAVNRALRQGLYRALEPNKHEPYRLKTYSLGKSLVNLDDIGEALAIAEGKDYR